MIYILKENGENPEPRLKNHREHTLCSSPVTEDVPPRRDRSSHGVPPSVTGLVHSRSVPLHPTSVNGLVHSPSVHSVNALHSYMPTHVCTHSWPYPAEFNHRNRIQPSTTTCIQPSATIYIQPSATIYLQPSASEDCMPSQIYLR
jgi:hypothetical protein